MTAWPATLSEEILQNGFSAVAQDNRVVSTPEVGDQKTRRRYTKTFYDFDLTPIPLSEAEKDDLYSFFHTTLADGTLTFTRQNPLTGASVTFRFLEPIRWEPAGPGAWMARCRMRGAG